MVAAYPTGIKPGDVDNNDLLTALGTRDPFAVASAYLALGLSPYAVRTDGSKAAAESSWTKFCSRFPTEAELRASFARNRRGVGIACGPASGNLVVFDFEEWSAFTRWGARLMAEERDRLARCPVVRTPRGGAHVYARLTAAVKGHVYARTAVGRVLIETRGDGHGVIAAGSPGCCHPTGTPYRLARPGWLDGVGFEPIPLDVFHNLTVHAAELNQYVKPAPREVVGDCPTSGGEPGDRPGDHFNARVSWVDILGLHGWTVFRTTEGATYWCRPGKSPAGISASTGFCRGPSGRDLLYVFTSSAPPLEARMSYSRFGAYSLLNHGGDFTAATRALGRAGYGRPALRRKAVRV